VPSRDQTIAGWTWIDLSALAAVRGCESGGRRAGIAPSPMPKIQQAGLIWVGEKFYPTPREFNEEASRMGVSRRIPAVPRDFKLGETWVALAHRHAIESEFKLEEKPSYKSAIFHVFKPSAIEYVVKRYDKDEKLEALEKRGISLVKVVQQEEPPQQELVA
jgi:hypothetical protein